jgi:phospholipase/lecithinase/hemolysin
VFIEVVVSGIQANLQRLYDLGLRDVMVANMFEIDCIPLFTASNGYTKCLNTYTPFVLAHNAFLLGAVQSINANNPGARFVILDQYSAFNRLFADASKAGFKDDLTPCCAGTYNTTSCGDVDASGKWLYKVCKHRGEAIFWDQMHPTMWAWNYIVNLYANEPHYILLADAPTLKQWLQINDAVPEPVAAPIAQPGNPNSLKFLPKPHNPQD